MQNNVNTNISWYEGHNYQRLEQKIKIFKILCTKYMASSEAMTSSTHSFAYSYGLVKKCFLKICETSKFHNFLIFQPIFIRFSLFCSENFTLSSKIKLDQLRTSPLISTSMSPFFERIPLQFESISFTCPVGIVPASFWLFWFWLYSYYVQGLKYLMDYSWVREAN